MGIESRFEHHKLSSVEKITTLVESLVDQIQGSEILKTAIIDETFSLRIFIKDSPGDDISRDFFVSELMNLLCCEFNDVDIGGWVERITDEIDDDTGHLLIDIDLHGLPE